MKTPIRCVCGLLPFLLTACFHKDQVAQVQQTAPAIVDVPLPTPPPPPADVPTPAQAAPTTQPAPATTPPPKQEEKPVKHKSRHTAPAVPVSENKTTEQASNNAPGTSAVSAIGQLSAGDATDSRKQTEASLASTENGLKAITRPLNDQEQKTAAQIREFLKQARAALATGDADGANTLALKAKVLLGEISQ
jgi:hypothetical protein